MELFARLSIVRRFCLAGPSLETSRHFDVWVLCPQATKVARKIKECLVFAGASAESGIIAVLDVLATEQFSGIAGVQRCYSWASVPCVNVC